MARINIEDSLFREDTFLSLIEQTGCRFKALGMVVSAFTIAQKFWSEHRSIPIEHWPKGLNPLIECGLVRTDVNGRSVYVKGSDKQFGWLEQKSNAGRSVSEKKLSSLQKARSARWNKTASDVNGSERDVNGSEALTLTLTPTLTPTLTQSLINNTIAQNTVLRASQFEQVYETYPKKSGKSRGFKRMRVQIKTESDLESLQTAINNYSTHCAKNIRSKEFIKQFDTFMSEWRDWLDPDNGRCVMPKDKESDDELAQIFRERGL